MNFDLIYHGHVPVLLKLVQMASNQAFQLINGIVRTVDIFSKTIENLFGLVTEKMRQNIILVFKVQVDGAVGDAGFFRNLCNGRLVESLLRKYFYGRFQNAVILVIVFTFGIDGLSPYLKH